MTTRLADVIVPEVFEEYMVEQTTTKTSLITSGIIQPDGVFNEKANSGGKIITLPFFQNLTGDDEVISDASDWSPTVGGIGTDQDEAIILNRMKVWGGTDLAAVLSGTDPMGVIANKFLFFWDVKEQNTLISTLKGVFADNIANDSGDLVHDISIDTTDALADANYISAEAIIDATGKLGDAYDQLASLCMHSVPFNRLRKADLIDFIPDSEGKKTIATYMGYRVIVNDNCPVVAGTNKTIYWTFIFGPGAIAKGEGTHPNAVEADRDSLTSGGYDMLIHRRRFILHPRGIKFTASSLAGSSPTNAELELAANWDRVYEKKNIRIILLKTNG